VKRSVEPELLDSLPGEDPQAIRSRRDLRLINALMGNERWICNKLKADERAKVELGAGSGELTRQLENITGLDFQDKPEFLERPWRAGNLFETLPEVEGPVVVANLILHHFQDEQLSQLGALIKERDFFIAVEPWRSGISLMEGRLLWPFINEVTRHDMMVSIRAGFQKGELKKLLNLGDEWEWKEQVSLLGGIRVVAWRK